MDDILFHNLPTQQKKEAEKFKSTALTTRPQRLEEMHFAICWLIMLKSINHTHDTIFWANESVCACVSVKQIGLIETIEMSLSE